MKNTLTAITVLCVMFLLASSCNKDKFKGPQGEPGPAGAQGIQGEPGAQGEPGLEVSTSGAITVLSTQWITFDSLEWTAPITAPMITQEVMNNGLVQVMVRKENAWHNLPFLDHTSFINFSYETGKVYLFLGDSHGAEPPRPETEVYKISVISSENGRMIDPGKKERQVVTMISGAL